MRHYNFFLVSVSFAFLLAACDKDSLLSDPLLRDGVTPSMVVSEGESIVYPKEVDYPVVPEDHPALECMRKKAHQIADIEWTPLKDVPGLTKPIPAGVMRTGIPYSSVREKINLWG